MQIKKTVTKGCLGRKKIYYRVSLIPENFINELERFGNLKIYPFRKKLVKVKNGTNFFISFVIGENRITTDLRKDYRIENSLYKEFEDYLYRFFENLIVK